MGGCLSLTGAISSSFIEVRDGLFAVAKQRGDEFEMLLEGHQQQIYGTISSQGTNTTIVYPFHFINAFDYSEYLSKLLSGPIFFLEIHECDIWYYLLFKNGEIIDRFNPIPNYWKRLRKVEKNKWKGNAELISKEIPNANYETISRYLVEWKQSTDYDTSAKTRAYPEDVHAIGDCWQMFDFMAKVGLPIPLWENGELMGSPFKLLER